MKTVILILGFLLCSTIPPLMPLAFGNPPMAQTTPAVQNSDGSGLEAAFTRVFSQLGGNGVMAWLAWYMVARAIPAKDAQIAEKDVQIKTQRDTFALELRIQRDEHTKNLESVLAELHKEREAAMEVIRRCPAAIHGQNGT